MATRCAVDVLNSAASLSVDTLLLLQLTEKNKKKCNGSASEKGLTIMLAGSNVCLIISNSTAIVRGVLLLIFFLKMKNKNQMGLFKAFQQTNSLPGHGVLYIFVAKGWGKK